MCFELFENKTAENICTNTISTIGIPPGEKGKICALYIKHYTLSACGSGFGDYNNFGLSENNKGLTQHRDEKWIGFFPQKKTTKG